MTPLIGLQGAWASNWQRDGEQREGGRLACPPMPGLIMGGGGWDSRHWGIIPLSIFYCGPILLKSGEHSKNLNWKIFHLCIFFDLGLRFWEIRHLLVFNISFRNNLKKSSHKLFMLTKQGSFGKLKPSKPRSGSRFSIFALIFHYFTICGLYLKTYLN